MSRMPTGIGRKGYCGDYDDTLGLKNNLSCFNSLSSGLGNGWGGDKCKRTEVIYDISKKKARRCGGGLGCGKQKSLEGLAWYMRNTDQSKKRGGIEEGVKYGLDCYHNIPLFNLSLCYLTA